MKVIVSIVALALSLAMDGTSSSVYAYELRGGAVVSSQFEPFHRRNQTLTHSFPSPYDPIA